MSDDSPIYGIGVYGVFRYTAASATEERNKHMATIALKLTYLSINDKIVKGRRGLTAAGSADGVTVLGIPAPVEVADLKAKTDALEKARDDKATADNIATTATKTQTAAEIAFNDAYAAYGRVGQTKSGGDPVKIGIIGMDVAATAVRSFSPTIVRITTLTVSMNEHEGCLDTMWDHSKGEKSYILEICLGDPNVEANWKLVQVCTSTRFTVTGLVSGTKYWFRVAALGAHNTQGAWSDPAEKMAP